MHNAHSSDNGLNAKLISRSRAEQGCNRALFEHQEPLHGDFCMTHGIEGKKRWLALIVLCLGVLMIVLDTTIVNVALPSIAADLGFSETSLVWVVNAYLLTFGGFLLLGGRLGDLYGQRRLFLLGITLFTLASLVCGLSNSQW